MGCKRERWTERYALIIFLLFLGYLSCGCCACFCLFNQFCSKQVTSKWRSFLQPCTHTAPAKSTLALSFIGNLLNSEVDSLIWPRSAPLEARPSWIASLPVGGISHSALDYPPLGCISHSSFVWPSLGGISDAGLVLPPWGALTGCQTRTVTSGWWICSGLALWGPAILSASGQRWSQTAHQAVVCWLRIINYWLFFEQICID